MKPNAQKGFSANAVYTKKTGETVEVFEFQNLENVFVSWLSIRDSNFGKQWELTLEDGQDVFLLQMGYGSNVAVSLLNAIASVGLGQIFTISAWSSKPNAAGVQYTNTSVYKDGERVKWLIPLENMPKIRREKNRFGKEVILGEEELICFVEDNIIPHVITLPEYGS